jgi:hypothetical protein
VKSYRHRFGDEKATTLINATGAVDRRLTSAFHSSLIAEMRAAGIHQPYMRDCVEHEGVNVDMSTLRAIGSRSIYVANMFPLGPRILHEFGVYDGYEPVQLLACGVLLAVYTIAGVVSVVSADWLAVLRFIYYAATAIYIVLASRMYKLA